MSLPPGILVIGVSGSGKTTVGRTLAENLGWTFLDADDFHPAANREKMHAGLPLTDDDRLPWLERLNRELLSRRDRGEPVVLACSALRESYREILRRGFSGLAIVFLEADEETIKARVRSRPGHFFPERLVESQFQTLEPPLDALVLDATRPTAENVRRIRAALGFPTEGKVTLR